MTYLSSVLGESWHLSSVTYPASLEDKAQIAELMSDLLPELIREGDLKPQTNRIYPGGVDGVSDAIKYMKDGKVNFEKILFRVVN